MLTPRYDVFNVFVVVSTTGGRRLDCLNVSSVEPARGGQAGRTKDTRDKWTSTQQSAQEALRSFQAEPATPKQTRRSPPASTGIQHIATLCTSSFEILNVIAELLYFEKRGVMIQGA